MHYFPCVIRQIKTIMTATLHEMLRQVYKPDFYKSLRQLFYSLPKRFLITSSKLLPFQYGTITLRKVSMSSGRTLNLS